MLAGCSATISEPACACSSRTLTKIQRRSPVRVRAKPPASLLPCNLTDKWPGSSRRIWAGPSTQMITAPLPRACPWCTPSKSPASSECLLDWHGQPAHCRIKGWSLGNGPRAQDLADLDPEIEMQPRRVMNLHDKTGRRHLATVPRPQAAEPRPGVAPRSGRLSPVKVTVQCRRP